LTVKTVSDPQFSKIVLVITAIIVNVAKNILKIVLVITAIIFIVKLGSYYTTKDADVFCQGIASNDSVGDVEIKAKEKGYNYIISTKAKATKIIVSTQDSPFFRFACVATFENDGLISKEVQADD